MPTVFGVAGNPEYSIDDGKVWKPVKPRFVFHSGAMFRTQDHATIDLVFGPDRRIIRINPESQVRIDQLDFETRSIRILTRTKLFLSQGEILGGVRKYHGIDKSVNKSVLWIKTPGGTAELSQCDFRINAAGLVDVLDGGTGLVYSNALSPLITPVELNPGEMTVPAKPGEPPVIASIPSDILKDQRNRLLELSKSMDRSFVEYNARIIPLPRPTFWQRRAGNHVLILGDQDFPSRAICGNSQ